MKQVVLLQGGIETLEFFSRQMAKALQERGIPVFLFTLTDERTEIPDLVRFLAEPGAETMLLTFNFQGLDQEAVCYDEAGVLLWNRYQVECRNILVDHPFYYFRELQTLPERYVQICIDGYHERYMRRFYPEVTLGTTTPLAGTRLTEAASSGAGRINTNVCLPIADRPRKLIFTGNYSPPEHFDQYITRLGPEYEAFYREMIKELFIHTERSMEDVFEEYLLREMGTLSKKELCEGMSNLIFLDLYVRFYFRGEVVKCLIDNGIPVEVYGHGWEKLVCKKPENLIQGGLLNSRECLEKTAEAQLSLNVMPWFKQGAHDRIYNAMRNGAVCISDTSEYLLRHVRDGQELFFYTLPELEALPERVRNWQKDPYLLQQVADRAFVWAEEHANWNHFLDQICEI